MEDCLKILCELDFYLGRLTGFAESDFINWGNKTKFYNNKAIKHPREKYQSLSFSEKRKNVKEMNGLLSKIIIDLQYNDRFSQQINHILYFVQQLRIELVKIIRKINKQEKLTIEYLNYCKALFAFFKLELTEAEVEYSRTTADVKAALLKIMQFKSLAEILQIEMNECENHSNQISQVIQILKKQLDDLYELWMYEVNYNDNAKEINKIQSIFTMESERQLFTRAMTKNYSSDQTINSNENNNLDQIELF